MARDEDDIVDGAMVSRSWGLARPAARYRGRWTWELNVGSLASNSTINQSQRPRRSAEDEELNSGGTTQQSTYSTATRELQTSGDGNEDDGKVDGATEDVWTVITSRYRRRKRGAIQKIDGGATNP